MPRRAALAATSTMLDVAKGFPDVFESFVDTATRNFVEPLHEHNRRIIEENRQRIAAMKARNQLAIAINSVSSQFNFAFVHEAERGRRGRNTNPNTNLFGGPGKGTAVQGGESRFTGSDRAGNERSLSRHAREMTEPSSSRPETRAGPGRSPSPTNGTAQLDSKSHRGLVQWGRSQRSSHGTLELPDPAARERAQAHGHLNTPSGRKVEYWEYYDLNGKQIGYGVRVTTPYSGSAKGKNSRAAGAQRPSTTAYGGQKSTGQKAGVQSARSGSGTGVGQNSSSGHGSSTSNSSSSAGREKNTRL